MSKKGVRKAEAKQQPEKELISVGDTVRIKFTKHESKVSWTDGTWFSLEDDMPESEDNLYSQNELLKL